MASIPSDNLAAACKSLQVRNADSQPMVLLSTCIRECEGKLPTSRNEVRIRRSPLSRRRQALDPCYEAWHMLSSWSAASGRRRSPWLRPPLPSMRASACLTHLHRTKRCEALQRGKCTLMKQVPRLGVAGQGDEESTDKLRAGF